MVEFLLVCDLFLTAVKQSMLILLFLLCKNTTFPWFSYPIQSISTIVVVVVDAVVHEVRQEETGHREKHDEDAIHLTRKETMRKAPIPTRLRARVRRDDVDHSHAGGDSNAAENNESDGALVVSQPFHVVDFSSRWERLAWKRLVGSPTTTPTWEMTRPWMMTTRMTLLTERRDAPRVEKILEPRKSGRKRGSKAPDGDYDDFHYSGTKIVQLLTWGNIHDRRVDIDDAHDDRHAVKTRTGTVLEDDTVHVHNDHRHEVDILVGRMHDIHSDGDLVLAPLRRYDHYCDNDDTVLHGRTLLGNLKKWPHDNIHTPIDGGYCCSDVPHEVDAYSHWHRHWLH